MYQGETVTTTITDLPISTTEIANIYIIFKTKTKTILEKTLVDCEVNGEVITFTLSQEESLSFPTGTIERSIIVIAIDGSRFECDPCTITCGKTAKSEVLK